MTQYLTTNPKEPRPSNWRQRILHKVKQRWRQMRWRLKHRTYGSPERRSRKGGRK